jgi:hypothetical protein
VTHRERRGFGPAPLAPRKHGQRFAAAQRQRPHPVPAARRRDRRRADGRANGEEMVSKTRASVRPRWRAPRDAMTTPERLALEA